MSRATTTGSRTKRSRGSFVPSPEQIRKACLEIQEAWTEEERARRKSGGTGKETVKFEVVSRAGQPLKFRLLNQRPSLTPAVHVSLPHVELAQAN